MINIGRCIVIALFASLCYLVGTRLVERFQRRQTSQRSAEIELRLRGSKQPWAFESAGGIVHMADSPNQRWRLLFLGVGGCTACVRQQAAYVASLSGESPDFTRQFEVWLISDRFVVWSSGRGPAQDIRVLSLKYSTKGIVQSSLGNVRPIVILIDPRGVVQRLRAGFVRGDAEDFIDRLRTLVGPGLVGKARIPSHGPAEALTSQRIRAKLRSTTPHAKNAVATCVTSGCHLRGSRAKRAS